LRRKPGLRITRTGWCGVVVIAVGIFLFAGFVVWSATTTSAFVDVPVSSRNGITTAEFKTYSTGVIMIRIEDAPYAANATWTLSNEGVIVAHGSTLDSKRSDWRENEGIIGSYRSEPGHKYRLEIAFTADEKWAAGKTPRLKVAPVSDLGDAISAAVVTAVAFGIVVLGLIVVVISSCVDRLLTDRPKAVL
jgi:hypothetical protein